MTTIGALAAWVTGSCLSAELFGYWLHRLLHSGAIAFLSRSHMTHHLLVYSPLQEQRSAEYRDATTDRWALGNIGTEWLLPAVGLIAMTAGIFHLLHVRSLYEWVYFTTTPTWSFLMFSELHDMMHVQNFWLERTPMLKRWFVNARRKHDLHHFSIDDHGLMNKNFGIGFYLFDRLFGTFSDATTSFNRKGYQVACERFKSMLGGPSQEKR